MQTPVIFVETDRYHDKTLPGYDTRNIIIQINSLEKKVGFPTPFFQPINKAVSYNTNHINHIDTYLFSSPRSRTYKQILVLNR
jgi:hypothetical protein